MDSIDQLLTKLRPQSVSNFGKLANIPKIKPRSDKLELDRPNVRQTRLRPKAPIRTLGCGVNKQSKTVERKRPRRNANKSKEKTTMSLDQSLKSLDFFQKHNRDLNSMLLSNLGMDEKVHFINIADEKGDTNRLFKNSMDSIIPEHFPIPNTPKGRYLSITVMSNWGDPALVGMTGLEVFDRFGHKLELNGDKVCAPDLNDAELEVNGEKVFDPRIAANLVDGHLFTKNDLHSWVAKFEQGEDIQITIDLEESYSLGVIRLYNYNRSRIHSHRGVRYVEMKLDGKYIAKLEVKKAPGDTRCISETMETIWFSQDPSLLQNIEKHDQRKSIEREPPQTPEKQTPWLIQQARPKTASRNKKRLPFSAAAIEQTSTFEDGFTAVSTVSKKKKKTKKAKHADIDFDDHTNTTEKFAFPTLDLCQTLNPHRGLNLTKRLNRPSTAGCVFRSSDPVSCSGVKLILESNHGDFDCAGLSKLVLIKENFEPMLQENFKNCFHQCGSLSEMSGSRDLLKLLDPDNSESFEIPIHFLPLEITIEFNEIERLRDLIVYNFNESLDESYKGIQRASIGLMTGSEIKFISPPGGLLIRKAPGNDYFDYGQRIDLTRSHGANKLNDSESSPSAEESEQSSPKLSNEALKHGMRGQRTKNANQALRSIRIANQLELVKGHNDLSITGQHTRINNTKQQEFEQQEFDDESYDTYDISDLPSENIQQYMTPNLPSGFVWKIKIKSTHGCDYYVGLSGIEMYDQNNCKIMITEDNLAATPYRDITQLESCSDDMRTLDNLLSDTPITKNAHEMWLAPFTTPGTPELIIIFDEIQTLSLCKLYNYAKEGSLHRGVKDFEITVDDQLLFAGEMRKTPEEDSHENWCHSVLFTNDPMIISNEIENIYKPSEDSSHVLFIDEDMEKPKKTSNSYLNRPSTSVRSQ
eukprot:TRINITY_DN30814_c0_g1_i2.p1 TRINITY_DN30814_c0_g1~~TRINITY_DN30814_c0_g1_i2.p1  ORF type:complete len:923 (+),score=243.24 TRINITY_DN30814_c0_g1_i2:222-2990(+)